MVKQFPHIYTFIFLVYDTEYTLINMFSTQELPPLRGTNFIAVCVFNFLFSIDLKLGLFHFSKNGKNLICLENYSLLLRL